MPRPWVSFPPTSSGGCIKAEVIVFDDLVGAVSIPAARAAGKARIHGKDYVADGVVVEFRCKA